ncbi:MAG: tetratricopeptide repeat protein [Candidatus Margulisiibacteriota bacterium]
MNIWRMFLGNFNPTVDKENKFREIDKSFEGDDEMIATSKAIWLTSRGNNYGISGNFDLAISDFNEAISLKPDQVMAHVSLGIAYREKGLLDKALLALLKAPHATSISGKEISGFDAEIYGAIMTIYLLKEDTANAIEYAKKTLAALDNPQRKEMQTFAMRAGVINESNDDQQRILLRKLINTK